MYKTILMTLGVCIIHKNNIINFFSNNMPHHIQDWMTKISSIVYNEVFYTIKEKYPLECVFVYNLAFLIVSLFLLQACIFFV